jgi:hypothetical protein
MPKPAPDRTNTLAIPAHVTKTLDPPAPPTPAATAATPEKLQTSGAFFGGKGLSKYHLPGCRFGERIPQGDRVYFRTRQEAEKGGRVACPFCAPGQEPQREVRGTGTGVKS